MTEPPASKVILSDNTPEPSRSGIPAYTEISELSTSGYLCSKCTEVVRLTFAWNDYRQSDPFQYRFREAQLAEAEDNNVEEYIERNHRENYLNKEFTEGNKSIEEERSVKQHASQEDQQEAFLRKEISQHGDYSLSRQIHYNSWEDFTKSIRQGCRICAAIAFELKKNNSWPESSEDFSGTTFSIHKILKKNIVPSCELCFICGPLTKTSVVYFQLMCHDTALIQEEPIVQELEHSTPPWNVIQNWLTNCSQNHSCGKQLSSPRQVPTRLLEVGHYRSSIRLVSDFSPEFEEPYLTLSHCWGGADILKLTSKNFEEFSKSINITHLPLTFQHAIETTRKLGVGFLWIDSLCILQDSTDDWQAESARMQDVYANSCCNIAAHGGTNSYDGLYSERSSELWSLLTPFYVYIRSSDRKKIRTYSLICDGVDTRGFQLGPLLRRGWVTQERFLAPKIIYFGRDQLYWECASLATSEIRSYISPTLSWDIKSSAEGITEETFSSRWTELIYIYTKAQLSNPSDILVALSGVAKRFQQIVPNNEYVAGLWKNNLPFYLCWQPLGNKMTKEYRAPSWSWASIEGGCCWHQRRQNDGKNRNLCEIRNIEVTLKSDDPTGAVLGGTLTIQSVLHSLQIDIQNMAWNDIRYHGKEIGNAQLQEDFPIGVREMLFAPLFDGSDSTSWVHGMIIRPSGIDHGQYVRAGWGYILNRRRIKSGAHFLEETFGTEADETIPCLHFDSVKGHTISII